jgi:hypothetical protein
VVSKEDSFDRRKIGLNRAFFLIRFLLTKSLVRRENLSDIEIFCLKDLSDQVIFTSDHNFLSKNISDLLILKLILKTELYVQAQEPWKENQRQILVKKDFFLSPRAFLGQAVNLEKELFKRINRRLRKIPPPQRFIGVGYRDKGNAPIRHLDGSPSWQEVVGASPDKVRKDFAKERGPQAVRSSRFPSNLVIWNPL